MTLDQLFEAFGGPTKFGEAIGVHRTHAGTMQTRGSIPPKYWPALIKAAAERGIEGVTAESLMDLAVGKNAPAPSHEAAE